MENPVENNFFENYFKRLTCKTQFMFKHIKSYWKYFKRLNKKLTLQVLSGIRPP